MACPTLRRLFPVLLLLLGSLWPPTADARGGPDGSVIAEIEVRGNQRVETETVRSYLKLEPGDAFDEALIRDGLKKLFATGFFKDVNLERSGDILVVRVAENPMVNTVTFEGSDSYGTEELEQMIQLKARSIYNRAMTEKDLAVLRQAFRIKGLFLAKVDLLIKPMDNNTVELVYRIDEGEKSKVQQVRILGNDSVDYKTLMKKAMIQPTGWLSWFYEDDTYDREKLMFDQSHLRDVYLNQGYARVVVDSSVAEMTPDRRAFVITHRIHEGSRYRLGAIKIQGDFDELPEASLYEALEVKAGEWYNRDSLRASMDKLSDLVGDFGYALLDIQPELLIDDDQQLVHVTFQIKKGRRTYIDRIEVQGNTRTRDEVIRREMQVVEGERFSASRIRKSKQELERLNFFEKVEITTPPGGAPDRVNVEIKVEEKATGAFTVGAGFSTVDKMIGTASISQNNFLGKGQRASLSFTLSSRTSDFTLGFTEPYFMDRDISAGFDLYNRETNRLNTSAFKQSTFGGALRLGIPLSERFTDYLSYHFANVEITDIASNASATIRAQAERSPYLQSMVSNALVYNSLDDHLLPTKGQLHRLTTDFSGVGGDVTFARLLTDLSFYHTLIGKGDLVGHLGSRVGVIQGLGEDVPIFERFYLGGSRSLRGFKPGGVGPRTSDGEALGGTHFGQLSSELIFPILGLGDKGVRGVTFMDAGILGDMDDLGTNTQESEKPRAAAGFGVLWSSPFGPLRFEFGFPLQQEDQDRTQTFDFSIGTVL
ncbi:MAG: outer membrane protein assembly factor BamA [Magnetococcales bacterium]|nr:outer membrane protein assembly factor BamA [Magnetococcales bacterium]